MFHNSEPQACTARGTIATGIDPIEALGKSWQVLGFYAGAIVTYRDVDVFLILPEQYVDATLNLGVFNGISDQVGKGAVQLLFIARQEQWPRGVVAHQA